MTSGVVAVVLNWNRPALTDRAVAALARAGTPPPQVIIVDNGSADDSVDVLQRAHPEATVIALESNRGFAGGMNAGIRRALADEARYVWLLNNDTEVRPGALAAMLSIAEADPRIGAVAPILHPGGGGRSAPVHGGRVFWWLGLSGHLRRPARGEPEYLVGASLLVRREAIEDVGELDEGFFLYWEDTDYSLRLRRRGWRLAVAADAVVLHHEGGTLADVDALVDEYLTYSSVRFFRKHARLPIVPIGIGLLIRVGRTLVAGGVRPAWRIMTAAARAFAGRRVARPAATADAEERR